MVLAFKRNEAGPWNSRGHPPARFERYPCIVSSVHHKRRHANPREQRRHVSIAIGDKIAGGIGRRTGNSLKLIEPIGLLFAGTWNELGCEHLPECRIFLTPPESHQSHHRFSGFLLRLHPGAFLPADSITSEKDQMRNALGVSDRIGDRDG